MNLAELKSRLAKGRGRLDSVDERLASAMKEAQDLASDLEATRMAQAVSQKAAQDTQDQLKFHITDLVQSALDAVFPGKYKFGIAFEAKRGQSEARLYLERDGVQYDPVDSNGGGVVDILSLALRMACWLLSRRDNVLLLDEPMKNLSAQYKPIIAELLSEMSKRLGLQIIMVSHDADQIAVADRVFRVALDENSISRIKVIEG